MPSEPGGGTIEASGAGGDASNASFGGVGAASSAGAEGHPSRVELAAAPPERSGERPSPIAHATFGEAPADKRESRSEGASGGASDSGTPPDRAE
jgi:hypothetical protein